MERFDRARLSYRRAEEIFEYATRLLANPLASPEDIANLEGFTLHRLRHSALTHDAERGTSTPMLLARSRHASVRSLERYARPGVDAVAAHVAASDPAVRRRGRAVSLTACSPDNGALWAASSQVSDIRCFRGRYCGDPEHLRQDREG